MRVNLPVINQEVELDDEHAIVSKTDLDGNITYVNPYFEQVSGFAAEELQSFGKVQVCRIVNSAP